MAHWIRLDIWAFRSMMYDNKENSFVNDKRTRTNYYENQRSVKSVFRKLREFYGVNSR